MHVMGTYNELFVGFPCAATLHSSSKVASSEYRASVRQQK